MCVAPACLAKRKFSRVNRWGYSPSPTFIPMRTCSFTHRWSRRSAARLKRRQALEEVLRLLGELGNRHLAALGIGEDEVDLRPRLGPILEQEIPPAVEPGVLRHQRE